MRSTSSSVSLTSPADVIGVIPSMLGFHPAESVVLLGLEGVRRRTCLTMRADLPDRTSSGAELSRLLADRLVRAGAEAAIVVIFTSTALDGAESGTVDPGSGWPALPYAAFATRLGRDVERAGGESLDLLLTSGGRIWSYSCRDVSCCPVEGIPVPTVLTPAAARLQAEVVGRGGLVWNSRDELVDSVAAPSGRQAADLEPVFAAASDAVLERTLEIGLDGLRGETVELVRSVHGRYVSGGERVTDSEAARISVGLADVLARDDVLAWGGGPHPDVFVALLGDVVRRSLPPSDGPACIALAWAAYQEGNGALAQCALDRACLSDPESTLGQLLQQAIAVALPPRTLREMAADDRHPRHRGAAGPG